MLKAFKEAHFFIELSKLFHKEGPIYDKALSPWFVLRFGSFNF